MTQTIKTIATIDSKFGQIIINAVPAHVEDYSGMFPGATPYDAPAGYEAIKVSTGYSSACLPTPEDALIALYAAITANEAHKQLDALGLRIPAFNS
jgi:hypothetical protein